MGNAGFISSTVPSERTRTGRALGGQVLRDSAFGSLAAMDQQVFLWAADWRFGVLHYKSLYIYIDR